MKPHTPSLDKCWETLTDLFKENIAEHFAEMYESFMVEKESNGLTILDQKEISTTIVLGYNNLYLDSLDELESEIHQYAFNMDVVSRGGYFYKLNEVKENVEKLRNSITKILEHWNEERDLNGNSKVFNLRKKEEYEKMLWIVSYRFCVKAEKYITLFNEGMFEKSAETQKAIPAKDKIQINLSVDELALLFRCFQDSKGIEIQNNAGFYRTITSLFITKCKGKVKSFEDSQSEHSFKNKFLAKSNTKKEVSNVKAFLANVQQEVNKSEKISER